MSDTSDKVRHIEIEWGPTLDADLVHRLRHLHRLVQA